MIDNYDSFTYNIVQYLQELDEEVAVYRNDQITLAEIESLDPSRIVISPGPGRPDNAGISMQLINFVAKMPIKQTPLLGVCLGHQSIAQAFGGKIIKAKQVMHGKTSSIYHNNKGVFKNLPNPFVATRYHSLVIEQLSLPSSLDVTAWTQNDDGSIDEIMGIKHKSLPVEGVQFHPESILTEHGHQLLNNFLETYKV